MKSIGEGSLSVSGIVGSTIDECVTEARETADKLKQANLCDEVILRFNDKVMVIMYDGIIKSVSEIYAQYYLGGKS